MAGGPGRIYGWLASAVKKRGSQRALYTAETTLSRRGLLTRADRRARELESFGLRPGEVLAVSLGNVADYFVALMGASKMGAIVFPIDPANGDRALVEAMRRVPVRAVLRRQRGLEGAPLEYPEGYTLASRRQMSASLIAIDVLDPPADLAPPPADTELIVEAVGSDDVTRDVFRDAGQVEAIGLAAAHALELEAGTRLVCVQALTAPSFFDPVVLGWLASECQLVIAGGPGLDSALPLAQGAERIVAVDTTQNFLTLARALKVSNQTLELTPVLPGLSPSPLPGRLCKQRFGTEPRELLTLEETGVLGSRVAAKGNPFELAPGVELRPGGSGGLQARTGQAGTLVPSAPADTTGALSEDGWIHTGYRGVFSRDGELKECSDRTDAIVRLEGRRASLDRIRAAMLEHQRIKWAQPVIEVDGEGEPILQVRYYATGQTELEDLDEHMIGELPPYMVPRVFERLSDPPADLAATDD